MEIEAEYSMMILWTSVPNAWYCVLEYQVLSHMISRLFRKNFCSPYVPRRFVHF
jgi:hypothetical protein